MARVIEISVSSAHTADLLDTLQRHDGVIGVKLFQGASIRPAGDVISAEMTNRAYHPLLRLLEKKGIGKSDSSSFSASEPTAIYSHGYADALARDWSEASPEEVEFSVSKESNMTANGLALMLCGGTLASLGISSGAVELVIGAQVISPGFECISRAGLGVTASRLSAKRGAIEMAKAYGALITAALFTGLVLRAMGKPVFGGEQFYVSGQQLASYWTSLGVSSVWTSAAAAIAGVILLAANRSILTAGAMIGLGLVPAASMVGMGLAAGDLNLAGQALARWAVEVLMVFSVAVTVFKWKRTRIHKREMIV